jgi:hypothetical protein
MAYETDSATNTSITVGATSVLISGKKARKLIYLRNTSAAAQVITLAFDNSNPAVALKGIVLAPGEFFLDSLSETYKPWSGEIKAIASAAGATLALQEQKVEDFYGS